MDHSLARELADKVAASILRSGRSKSSVALEAGIALTTFNRKINGHVEFSFGDLLRIAAVLRVPPSTFTPTSFAAESALAGAVAS